MPFVITGLSCRQESVFGIFIRTIIFVRFTIRPACTVLDRRHCVYLKFLLYVAEYDLVTVFIVLDSSCFLLAFRRDV